MQTQQASTQQDLLLAAALTLAHLRLVPLGEQHVLDDIERPRQIRAQKLQIKGRSSLNTSAASLKRDIDYGRGCTLAWQAGLRQYVPTTSQKGAAAASNAALPRTAQRGSSTAACSAMASPGARSSFA